MHATTLGQIRRLVLGLSLIFSLQTGIAAQAQAQPPDGERGCDKVSPPAFPLERQTATLSIRFYGVTTLLFDDDEHQLLVDGFFTRPGPLRTLFGELESNPERFPAVVGRAGAPLGMILVAHAHHDHALDAPRLAIDHPGAVIVGTPSVVELARAQGVPEGQLCTGKTPMMHALGRYEVQPLAADHGPALPLLGRLLDRPLKSPPTGGAHFLRFQDDENLSFFIRHGAATILVHPSAGLPDRPPPPVDVVFLGMGRVGVLGYEDARQYFGSVLGSQVKVVIPIHWDAFTSAPDVALAPQAFPFDRVPRGFEYLCRFLSEERIGALAMKPAMGSEMTTDGRGEWVFDGSWARTCK